MAKPSFVTARLEQQIAVAATAFAREIVGVISRSTVSDLLALERGRPVTVTAQAPARQIALAAPVRKRNWPKCGQPGCSNSYYPASGLAHLCYAHFMKQGGKHPSKRR